MVETKTTPKPTADVRRTGEARTGGSGKKPEAKQAVLTKENLRKIGVGLNGRHWQTDVAKATGNSKSQMTRYLNGEREINPLLPRHLQYVLVRRLEEIANLLNTPGMPYAGSPEVEEVVKTITVALAKVPGTRPPQKYAGSVIL